MQTTRPNEFIALVAMLTALVAMSIDTMLPAVGTIATELGATNPNDRQYIIFAFFLGMTFGTLIFGPISDSVGRKITIYVGLIFFIAGAVLCMFATSFPMLIAGRLLQGFGAASPRIVSMAMVRDGSKGADMARIMSFVMMTFMLVPILAPTIGMFVLRVASWRWIFAGFIAAAGIVTLWLALRQAETLAPENRHEFTLAKLTESAVEVIRNPVALGYTLAVGFIFGAFTTFLGTAQQIFAEQFHQGDNFPYWFGALATGIALSMFLNGTLVHKLGMREISKWALRVFLVNWCLMLAISYSYGAALPILLAAPLFYISFFVSGLIFGNYNSMALEPMGHIAGMAAAISGAGSSLLAVGLGVYAGSQYNGTMVPLAIAFVAFGFGALLFSEYAEWGRARQAQKSHA